MRISGAKLRVAVLLLIGITLVALAASACMSVGIHWSPRYQVLDSYFRPNGGYGGFRDTTRDEFEQFVREHNLPYEIEGGEGIDTILIPLDGTRRGQHFRARFFADGMLREAYTADRSGESVEFHIRVHR